MVYRYREIADDLTARLDAGEWLPGSKLPGIHRLATAYGVGNALVQKAVAALELEGRVVIGAGRAGTVVVDATVPRLRLDVGRIVRRNEYGYLFTRAAGHWAPTSAPTRQWVPCPDEVAARLDVPADSLVLARHREVGPNDATMQLTTTYLPPDLARGTVLEHEDTGPGGYLDRLENDMGHGPLSWVAELSARLPNRDEAIALRVSSRLPVLVTSRLHISATARPVAVDVTVLDGLRFGIRWPLVRDASARWPTSTATARNRPGRQDRTE